jgi:RimJ/RimL family protein N-acetyltransferase
MEVNNPMKNPLILRQVTAEDLPTFFEQQLDPEANHMAAFTAKDPKDREAFEAHWDKIRADNTITIKTILYQGGVAGYVLVHSWFGEPEISYWLGREYWGQGIATWALSSFLDELETRPLYARAAKDNLASIRVLGKCGFTVSGEDKGFANARGEEVEEYIFKLNDDRK